MIPHQPSEKPPSSNSPRHPLSTKKKKASLSRDAISIPQLKKLEKLFQCGDEKISLNEPIFVKSFQTVIPELTEPQLVELFLKIDANADDEVSWDEVTQYLFVHAADADEISRSEANSLEDELSKDRFIKCPNNHHKYNEKSSPSNNIYHRGPVVKILYIDAGRGSYLTASLDGTVHSWDATTFLHRGCLIKRETAINDIVMLPMSKKLVVAEAHSTLSFHDVNSGSEYTRVSGSRLHQCTPTCIDVYWDDITRNEILIVGDDAGSVHTFGLKYKAWQIKDVSVGPHDTRIQKFEHVERGHLKNLHGEWISKIKFVEDLNSVVTCSMDGTVKLSDLHEIMRGELTCVRYVFDQHLCGVTDFAWSESNRMMVSAGVERGPLVWNPFSKSTVTQLSAGHASILSVTIDERRQRIISVDAANHIHVHSLKNYKQIQNLHQRSIHDHGGGSLAAVSSSSKSGGIDDDFSRLADNLRIGAMLFHDVPVGGSQSGSLITATMHLNKWDLSADITRGNLGPDAERAPIGCCLYNSSFHQIVTSELDDQSSICIWDPSTGNILVRFCGAHEGSAVTAMAFDSGERRLVTGSHDGTELHMFNFGNRRLLTRLVKLPEDVVASRSRSIEDEIVDRQIAKVEDAKYDDIVGLAMTAQLNFSNSSNTSSRSNFLSSPSLSLSSSPIPMSPLPLISPNVTRRSQLSPFTRGHLVGSSTKKSKKKNTSPMKGSIRMRESIIPPPASPKVMGSSLHRSLREHYKSRDRSKQLQISKKEKISHRTQPRKDRNIETNSEVTKIVYIEANSGGVHLQHFIATTGWDKNIYVFDDDNPYGRQEQGAVIKGYLFSIPREEQMFAKHQADITDIAYCDPSLASCSLDGYVRFWSLQNGEHLATVDIGKPVHKLAALTSYRTLIVASETNLVLISTISPIVINNVINMKSLCDCNTISILQVSIGETHLIVGDALGHVHILRVNSTSLEVIYSWSAHNDRVLNATFVENSENLDIFVITTSENAEVFMWTIDGTCVGNYGTQQHAAWTLGRPSTYKALCEKKEVKTEDKVYKKDEKHMKEKTFEKKKATVNTKFNLAELRSNHLPCVGEVWVRKHRSLASANIDAQSNSNTSGITSNNDPSNKNTKDRFHFEHSDILTVQRVGRESVVGWDGNFVNEAKLRHCPLGHFNSKTQNGWRLEPTLSKLVGNIYFGSDQMHDPYKVVCVCQKEIKNSPTPQTAVVVRDHMMRIRSLPSLSINEALPPRRSLSEAMEDRQDLMNIEVRVIEQITAVDKNREEEEEEFVQDVSKEATKVDKEQAIRLAQTTKNEFDADCDPKRGWDRTSYVKYGKLSKRTPQKINYKFKRLWESRLDSRRTYDPNPTVALPGKKSRSHT